LPDQGRWEPFEPADIAGLLGGYTLPWWIAGGWAIDLFVGRTTREHDDLDIEIPRNRLVELAVLLDGWDMRLAHGGSLYPWRPGEPIPDEVNGLWCRPDPGSPWRFQILLAQIHGDTWRFRRDPRITRPTGDVGFQTAHGLPVIAPEIQLLYKASGMRPKDELDLNAAWPLLTAGQRAWLISALGTWKPDHPWLSHFTCRGNESCPSTRVPGDDEALPAARPE
jgi:hypothetical protein